MLLILIISNQVTANLNNETSCTYLKNVLGEKCDVRLEVQLESALEQLYDILVLHLEGGKDVFITVTGNGQRSSFTTSFSALCRAPVPILHLTPEQLAHAVSFYICSNIHFIHYSATIIITK